MGFDFFKKKSFKKSSDSGRRDEVTANSALNKRKFLRFLVCDAQTNYGEVFDISNGGVRLRKVTDINREIVRLDFGSFHVNARIVWEDAEFVGLAFEEPVDLSGFCLSFPEEIEVEPFKAITEKDLLSFKSADRTKTVVNLMSELSDPNTNVDRFKVFIKELPELEEEILDTANSVEHARQVFIKDVDLAVVRLGFESIKEIAGNFVRKKVSMSNPLLSDFKNYEAYNILKGVLFKKLSSLWGFKDLRSEGSSLLATETVGANILTGQLDGRLRVCYRGAGSFYSYATRLVEQIVSGKNLVDINGMYFKNILGMFEFLFDGYVLGHLTYNPMLEVSEDYSITLSQRKLKFGFVSYLVFSGLSYILSGDRERGHSFVSRLRRAGMGLSKALDFVNACIFEANEILDNIGLRKVLRPVSVPYFSFRIDRFFPDDIHFGHFLLSFRKFASSSKGRIVIRGDDNVYMMYVLSKLLNIPDFGFDTRSFVVIPCGNLSDEVDTEYFSVFDLVVFRDFDKLDVGLFDSFMDFWRNFEGAIIATFSSSSINLDFMRIINMMNGNLVDFPSSLVNDKIYTAMLEHCAGFLKGNVAAGVPDIDAYRENGKVYSMKSVLESELRKFISSLE